MPRFRFIIACVALFFPQAIQAQQRVSLSNLSPIPLHSGVNLITNFAPDGATGMIVLGWRENGNAHSFDLALIMTQQHSNSPWNIARIEGVPGSQNDMGNDVVEDYPHTGDDMVSAFRFARGDVNGNPSTLLLKATRDIDFEAGIPAPSLVTFEAYQLVYDPEVGTTDNHFQPILTDRSTTTYCNADTALSTYFGLPRRSSNEAPISANGC